MTTHVTDMFPLAPQQLLRVVAPTGNIPQLFVLQFESVEKIELSKTIG